MKLPDTTRLLHQLGNHGWVLVCGCALAAIGLARGPQGNRQEEKPPFTTTGGSATADSNNRMIAVTGIDLTGASILYLVDTVNYRLAVYQATGGTESTQGIKLVGARRIDLDMQLDGLNDKSEFTYKKLRKEFEKNGLLGAPGTGEDQ
jgi:hypothetical protein